MKPGGIVKLRSPRNWSPSSRSSCRAKAVWAPATELEVPAASVGWKGRICPGHWRPVGAGLDAEDLIRVDFGGSS